MNVQTNQEDPLSILHTTKYVLEHAQHVSINEGQLDTLAQVVERRLNQGLESSEDNFGTTGTYEEDLQLVFLETCVNFCFWSESGEQNDQWFVEWPKDHVITSGWYSIKGAFQRAMAEGKPILDSHYLEQVTLADVHEIFRGHNNIDIPLLEHRHNNLKQAGNILSDKWDGQISNLIKAAHGDAIKVVELIIRDFPFFRDTANYHGHDVMLYKRAQIFAFDIHYVMDTYHQPPLDNLNQLTAFADYRLPQFMRHMGVLEYTTELAQQIDNYALIEQGSDEEIEIRAVTIWIVELLRQKLNKYSMGEIDNAIWLLSQDVKTKMNPHHRTYSIFY